MNGVRYFDQEWLRKAQEIVGGEWGRQMEGGDAIGARKGSELLNSTTA